MPTCTEHNIFFATYAEGCPACNEEIKRRQSGSPFNRPVKKINSQTLAQIAEQMQKAEEERFACLNRISDQMRSESTYPRPFPEGSVPWFVSQFPNGEERFNKDPFFRMTIDQLARGASPFHCLNELLRLLESQRLQIEALAQRAALAPIVIPADEISAASATWMSKQFIRSIDEFTDAEKEEDSVCVQGLA